MKVASLQMLALTSIRPLVLTLHRPQIILIGVILKPSITPFISLPPIRSKVKKSLVDAKVQLAFSCSGIYMSHMDVQAIGSGQRL